MLNYEEDINLVAYIKPTLCLHKPTCFMTFIGMRVINYRDIVTFLINTCYEIL